MNKKKIVALARKGKTIKQVAALPYRLTTGGEMELMLVTSRRTQRFLIPKGWPMKGKTDPEAAVQEAAEEAGVIGKKARKPIGSFRYWKRLRAAFVPITVTVFPLEVQKILKKWPEERKRQRAWLTPDQAGLLVDEPELIALVRAAGNGLSQP
jgi:8-oxo-dGTP pyrophosphatase MutT (NUDIX family)